MYEFETAELIQTSSVINSFKKRLLKKETESFVMKLDEKDNPIVKISEFK